jgi:hypothetical protein
MSKPLILKGSIKHKAIKEDRHLPTMPSTDAALWARSLTTTRVADLFLTLKGLPGHWMQIQLSINAGNKYFFQTTQFGQGRNDGGRTTEEGKQLIKWIADAIIGAAEDAPFDFPLMQMKFTDDLRWLKILKKNGRLVIASRP